MQSLLQTLHLLAEKCAKAFKKCMLIDGNILQHAHYNRCCNVFLICINSNCVYNCVYMCMLNI